MAALTTAARFWWAPVIAGLAVWALILRADVARLTGKLQHADDVMAMTTERINHATAEAQAADRHHAQAVAGQQDTISKDAAHDLETNLAAARADAAAYARRLRLVEAAGSGVREPHLPTATEPAGSAAGAREASELDALACAEAVTKAEAWPAWWRAQAAIER